MRADGHERGLAVDRARSVARRRLRRAGRIGVLIVNLGTPDATDRRSVRRYLQGISLRPPGDREPGRWSGSSSSTPSSCRCGRASKAATTRRSGIASATNRRSRPSPARRPRSSRRARSRSIGRIMVDWAMRYGNPSIASRLEALVARGCERILLVPLYPQYAAATTATVCDEAFRALIEHARQPALRVVPPYYDDPVYIEALAASMRGGACASCRSSPRSILASFHGIPKDYVRQGRSLSERNASRRCGCCASARLDESKLMLTFQSRFGRAEWLQPYTDKTVKALAQARREESRGGDAGLFRRLPGDAGGDRGRERAISSRPTAARISPRFPCLNDSEPGMAGDPRRGVARIEGVGVSMLLRVPTQVRGPITSKRYQGLATCLVGAQRFWGFCGGHDRCSGRYRIPVDQR